MQRIALSRQEKQVLRNTAIGYPYLPKGLSGEQYTDAVISLTEKRLIRSTINYDEVVSASLTTKGKSYMQNNPHLRNPVNWTVLTAVSTAITALAAVATLAIHLT